MTRMEERRPGRDQRGSQKEPKGRGGCQQVPKGRCKSARIEPKDDQSAIENCYLERHTEMIPNLIQNGCKSGPKKDLKWQPKMIEKKMLKLDREIEELHPMYEERRSRKACPWAVWRNNDCREKYTASTREHELEGLKDYKTEIRLRRRLIKSNECDMQKLVRNVTKWRAKRQQ